MELGHKETAKTLHNNIQLHLESAEKQLPY